MEKGLLHLYWGEGKGKTTAAVGLAVRALGCGRRVTFVQFLKDGSSHELAPLRRLGAAVFSEMEDSKFVFQMTPEEKAAARIQQTELLRRALASPCDLLVLARPAPRGRWIPWTGTCCGRRCWNAPSDARRC